jgi:hypothetical protein
MILRPCVWKGLGHMYGSGNSNASSTLPQNQPRAPTASLLWVLSLGHTQLTTTAIYAKSVREEERSIAARVWQATL